MGDAPKNGSQVVDDNYITVQHANNRWRTRRRLSIAAFCVLCVVVYQAVFSEITTAENIVITLIYALVAIILVYIAGPIVDDWLQSKKS